MDTSRKTLGPFTGRQLTTIICVVIAAIAFPVGAWAVSLTNVSITDPGGVNHAKVDSTGRLDVGDGSGPLTVDGAVSSTAALPAKPITIALTGVEGTLAVLYGPQSKRFGITNLVVFVPSSCDDQLVQIESVTSSGGKFPLFDTIVNAGATQQFTFPTPLVLTPPTGGTVSLEAAATTCVAAISGVGVQT